MDKAPASTLRPGDAISIDHALRGVEHVTVLRVEQTPEGGFAIWFNRGEPDRHGKLTVA